MNVFTHINKYNTYTNKTMDKTNRRQKIADKKMASASSKSQKRQDKINSKYGYDYRTAISSGITPDSSGHWASRDPETGKILKGKKHPTIGKTKAAEKSLGNKIVRMNGSLYSIPKSEKRSSVKPKRLK